jgi:hypothetical protein
LGALDARGIRTRCEEAGAVCGEHDEPEHPRRSGAPRLAFIRGFAERVPEITG